MAIPNSLKRVFLVTIGLLMVVFAIAVSNQSYADILVSNNAHDLSWGPSLFRILAALHGGLLVLLGFKWSLIAGDRKLPVSDKPINGRQKLTPAVIGVLIALSIIASALRIWNLNSDLWIDEVLTLLDFVRTPIGEIVTSFPSQNQHMLFSILAHTSIAVFGESAWALRLPSVIFGVGSVWAFFFLVRRLLGNREALFGCALMTVSYHHIWFSQNARGYMGLLFFTLTATWCWFGALEDNRWRWWVGYIVSVVLGMWIHPTMAFVVAAHGLVHLVLLLFPSGASADKGIISLERRAGLRPFVSWGLSVTLTLQLYALALPEFLAVGLHEESMDSEWTHPLWVITESIKGLSVGFAGMVVVLVGAAFVAFGWVSLLRTNRRAAVLTVLPAILAGGTMLLLDHNLWPRFFFFSMGFGLLIVIHGAGQLPRLASRWLTALRMRPRIADLMALGFSSIIIAASLVTVPKNYALPKQSFTAAKNFVEVNASPGDAVVAVNLAGVVYGRYLTPFWPVVTKLQELQPLQESNERLWLVYTLPIEIKAFQPELWRTIERDFKVVRVFPGTLNGGEVFVCQKR